MTQGKAGGVVGYFIVRCPKRSFSFSIDFLNTFLVNWRVGRPPCRRKPRKDGPPKDVFRKLEAATRRSREHTGF